MKEEKAEKNINFVLHYYRSSDAIMCYEPSCWIWIFSTHSTFAMRYSHVN
jgi:hypothetical protein